jgi:hypothetical protein
VRGFFWMSAEAKGKRHFLGLGEIDLANQGDVAVLRAGPDRVELSIAGEHLPAVRVADEACAGVPPGHRARQSQRCAAPFGKQHGHALIFPQPRRIAGAGIDQMGGEERINPIVSTGPRHRRERDTLQHHVAIWITYGALGDAIVPVVGVDQLISWNAGRQRLDLMLGVTLLLGEETVFAGDNEA